MVASPDRVPIVGVGDKLRRYVQNVTTITNVGDPLTTLQQRCGLVASPLASLGGLGELRVMHAPSHAESAKA
jgi:hypothetical protein